VLVIVDDAEADPRLDVRRGHRRDARPDQLAVDPNDHAQVLVVRA
jgi:hypothetical protein